MNAINKTTASIAAAITCVGAYQAASTDKEAAATIKPPFSLIAAAVAVAGLIHRTRTTWTSAILVRPAPPKNASLLLLAKLTKELILKYQHSRPKLIHDINTLIIKRVEHHQLTPELSLIALKALLHNSTNNSTEINTDGTLNNWKVVHPNNNTTSRLTATILTNDPPTLHEIDVVESIHGVIIGKYCFTTDKVYTMGPQHREDIVDNTLVAVQRPLRQRSSIESEQKALMKSFRLRRNSISISNAFDDAPVLQDAELHAYRSYLFSHLKSEVIILNKAGLAFIQREVEKEKSCINGFRKAHQVVKRIVLNVAGFQYNGQRWDLGDNYSDVLNKIPQHDLQSLWNAMVRLVVWYDNLPDQSTITLTEEELMQNLPHIILLARHAKVKMGIRSLIRHSSMARSPAHRRQMLGEAKILVDLHGMHLEESNDILRRVNSNRGGGRRRKRLSIDDSSVIYK